MIKLTVTDLYERATRLGGDRVALSHDGRSMTYRQLEEGARRLNGAFSELGLGRGSRVAFLMANCMEYVACEYAVARAGAVRIPLAVLLANDDHVYMMNFARCEALVYHEKMASRVATCTCRRCGAMVSRQPMPWK
jgi:acyl-CoA synthetase (AMP-forming)/AMP-acid ligase II